MESGESTLAAPMQVAVETAQYWPFAVVGALFLVITLRLLVRERIALQGSISFMTFLGIFLVAGVLPERTAKLAHAMGFTLLSNFLFCVGLMALAILHLRALVTLSRVEIRTVQLTQDLALVEEQLRRAGISSDRSIG
jgi:hypothetical protein